MAHRYVGAESSALLRIHAGRCGTPCSQSQFYFSAICHCGEQKVSKLVQALNPMYVSSVLNITYNKLYPKCLWLAEIQKCLHVAQNHGSVWVSLTGLNVHLNPFIVLNLFDLVLTTNRHKQKCWTFTCIFTSFTVFPTHKNLTVINSYPVDPQCLKGRTCGLRNVPPDLLVKT